MKRNLLIALMTILLLLTLVLVSCGGTSDVLTGVDIKFSTLSVEGSVATGEVSSEMETYSFLTEITVAEGASYTVAADVFGNEVYTFKTVPLAEGENTFYVFVENGNEMTMYTVVIYRTPVYIVTVDLGDGSEPTEQRVEEGKRANIPTPTREGYTFLGWNQDASMPITINTYFLANWKPNEYSITYDLNDGTNHPSNPSTYTIEDTVTLNTPQREGYAFAGWSLNGEWITQIPKGSHGNITLVATWRKVLAKQGDVIKYTPVMDGKLDAAYLCSASVSTSTDLTADPRENILLKPIWITSGATDPSQYAHVSGTIYVLWDGEYVYLCADMHDKTMYTRCNKYTTTIADPWLNENLDIYYLFGNDATRVAAGEETVGVAPNPIKYNGRSSIYPHYKNLMIDSLSTKMYSYYYSMASMYHDEIEYAGTYKEDGMGGYYYTIEMKFPAKQESVEILEGYTTPQKATEETLRKIEGRNLTAGDYLYFCFMFCDFNSWPSNYDYPEVTTDDFSAIDRALQGGPISCYGNRTSNDASYFCSFRLTDVVFPGP